MTALCQRPNVSRDGSRADSTPVPSTAREAYITSVCRGLATQLDVVRATLELHSTEVPKDGHAATSSATAKLAAAIDCFGTDLQSAWGVAAAAAPQGPSRGLAGVARGHIGCEEPVEAEEASAGPRVRRPQESSPKVKQVEEDCGEDEDGSYPTLSASITASKTQPSSMDREWARVVRRLLATQQVALELRPAWTQSVPGQSDLNPLTSGKLDKDALFSSRRTASSTTRATLSRRSRCIHSAVSSPTSKRRMFWDLFSVLVLLYDLFTLPLMVFEYNELNPADPLRLATSIFWTVDIPLSFLVGFESQGLIETRLLVVAKHYIRTWFPVDVIIVGVDWAMMLADAPSGAASMGRIGKTLRMLRVVRLLRVLRIAKLANLTEKMGSTVLSGGLHAFYSIFKWLGCLFLICHAVGCSWYWIGTVMEEKYPGDVDRSWVAWINPETSMTHRYAIAFHWAVSQFSPSSSPYNPKTLPEEIFNITFIFFGLTMFSSFIGSVTTTITSLRKGAMEVARQNSVFNEYARYHRLSWDLQQKIAAYARYYHRRKARVLEKDVPFLKFLPETLLIRTRCQVAAPALCKHPFFDYLFKHHALALMFVCHNAASECLYGRGDELFSFHAAASSMFFVVQGRADYYMGPHGTQNADWTYDKSSYAAEASLWLRFLHAGRLISQEDTDIVMVDALQFCTVMSSRPDALTSSQVYAWHFALRAIELGVELDTWGSVGESDHLIKEVLEDSDEATSDANQSVLAEFGLANTRKTGSSLSGKSFF